MLTTVEYGPMVQMLRGAAARIREHHALLSRLDSMGGDGDHGTTMLRVIAILDSTLNEDQSGDSKTLLKNVGWAVMGVDGGATGPLFGSFFMGMAEADEDFSALDAPALARCFEAGLAKLRKQTKAQVGDKTMIDAMLPAVEAMRQAAVPGGGILELLNVGAQASAAGAESTAALAARFGRAKNVKELSIGSPDAGATSVAYFFKGFLEGVITHA